MVRLQGLRVLKTLSLLTLPLISSLQGCQPGNELTEYQTPAFILKAFRRDHPHAESVTYRQLTRDNVRVYQVNYEEVEEDGEVSKVAWYNAQGKPFVSRSEKRLAEQEQQKLAEEREAKNKEDALEKAEQEKSEHETPTESASSPPPPAKH